MQNLIKPAFILLTAFITITGAEDVFYTEVGGNVTLAVPEDTLGMYRFFHFGSETGIKLAWNNPQGGKGVVDDEAWKAKLTLTDKSLTITNVQEENFGSIFLKVRSALGPLTNSKVYKIIKLKVHILPDGLLLPGEHLSLDCDVKLPRDQRAPDIHWLNPHGERENKTQGRTVLVQTSSRHNGSWTCVVGNKNSAKKSVTVMGLSPGVLHQYTSTNSPLSLPCSIPSYISWEQIKQKGVQEVQWHFSPKPSSSLPPGGRQRLFSLSLEGALTWVPDQEKGLKPTGELAKGSLSLIRNRATEGDRGDFTCSMKFKKGVTLNSTIHVQVLQKVNLVESRSPTSSSRLPYILHHGFQEQTLVPR